MDSLWYLLPFGVAFILTGLELITSKYPSTASFVLSSWAFGLLCFCYGLIAILGFSIFKFHLIKFEGMPDGDLINGLVSGAFSKAIVQLNLFTVTVGSQTFPIGLKTFVQIFEPYLLRKISIREYNKMQGFIEPIQARYTVLTTVINKIYGNIPSTFANDEIASFKNTIESIKTDPNLTDEVKIQQALEKFFRFAGGETLARVFP